MDMFEESSRLSRALNEIDIRVHSNLESDEILQSALEGLVNALHADAGDIKLIEDGVWVVRYQTGFSPDVIGLQLSVEDAPVADKVALTRQPVLISDYLAQDEVPYVGFPLQHALRSAIAVPLFIRGAVAGCLFAWMRAGPREYSEAELDFTKRMAASVAAALDNASLLAAADNARNRAEAAELKLRHELEVTKILLKASDELTSTTETDVLLGRLAQVVQEATGMSRVFINLIDSAQEVLIPKIPVGQLTAPAGIRIPLSELSETSRNAIIAGRTAILDFERPETPEYDRTIAAANRSRLVLFIPLIHHSEIIGHIAVDEPDARYDFSPKQIRVIESIAAQASVALQNARRYEREHRIAETLQQALIAPPEDIDAIGIALLYQAASAAARVGGDFYDAFNLDSDRVALVVGDVSGKGIGAAPLTALLRDGIRAYLLEGHDPAGCLMRVNTLAYRFTPPEKFATAFVAILNHTDGELHYCSAAHPLAIVMNDSAVQPVECNPGPLLGAYPDVTYEAGLQTLNPGDTLIVVTDGVTEARRSGRLLGEDGLLSVVTKLRQLPLERLPEHLLAEVTEYASGPIRDDIVVMCASLKS